MDVRVKYVVKSAYIYNTEQAYPVYLWSISESRNSYRSVAILFLIVWFYILPVHTYICCVAYVTSIGVKLE
jgi:hypothetical protein